MARNELAGTGIGERFADVRLLRTGSRFTAYAARELSTNRPVVIKLVDGPGAGWRHDLLVAEATILAAVGAHPNIVTLYQRLTLDDGRPALVLERCSTTLDDRLGADDRMSLEDTVATGVKLAGALETVHRAGVLHCDVRPHNVLVSEWGEPVLAGFEEAVYVESAATRPPLHVLTGHTAPELLEGQAPTAASDVYGLAATLYELVAGRAAFRAYAGESPATVIVRVLSSQVMPIVAPDVPLELSDLLTWALSPDPAKRPPSPAWLAEELGRIAEHEGLPHPRMLAG